MMYRHPQPNVSRRELLRLASAGFLGACAAPWFNALSARGAQAEKGGAKVKSCILLWMIGGPPQSLTFDIKKHSAIKSIATAAADVRISEKFPKLANEMKDVTLLRGMHTADSNHLTARYLMHTGFRKGQNAITHPVLGSIVASEFGDQQSELPNFISVGGPKYVGYGAGHLGPQFGPIRVEGGGGLNDLQPAGSMKEFESRFSLLNEIDGDFLADHAAPSVEAHRFTLERANRLMHSSKTSAFDLSREPAKVRSAYGTSELADEMLLARRLVESGVKFVEVRQDGWDVHRDTIKRTQKLSEALDSPLAALIADLRQRGLLDSTLVIAMGEFGRNPQNGSNHFSRAWTTLLAGGGLKNGQAIGDTGNSGGTVENHPISAADFMATVCQAVGIDHTEDWTTSGGRPVPKVGNGAKVVKDLF